MGNERKELLCMREREREIESSSKINLLRNAKFREEYIHPPPLHSRLTCAICIILCALAPMELIKEYCREGGERGGGGFWFLSDIKIPSFHLDLLRLVCLICLCDHALQYATNCSNHILCSMWQILEAIWLYFSNYKRSKIFWMKD